ncbi:MAG: DUF1566 domain-containing protein, partial [Myxococcaceae bacterium]|nr:DUF1566 domain-containing protein [Myxococcaceae bacterium]
IGDSPSEHPAVQYGLYFQIPLTPTVSETNIDTTSPSLFSVLTTSLSQSTVQPTADSVSVTSLTQSIDLSHTTSMSSENTISMSKNCWSGILAFWNRTTGVYSDGTSQLNRYYSSDGIVNDTLTGLQWESEMNNTTMNWTDSISYCAKRTTGNLSNWRLPNVDELQTLIDYTRPSPCINITVFPGTQTYYYWSSTNSASSSANAWYVNLGTGGYYYNGGIGSNYGVSATFYARCVRSTGLMSVMCRYTDEDGSALSVADQTVRDSITELVWQRTQSSSTMNQTAASSYCNSLHLNGFSFRLPTIRELSSLVDFNRYGPSIDPSAFPGTSADYFWSSTIYEPNPAYAWLVLFSAGNIDQLGPSSGISTPHYVRCCRDP